MKLLLSFAVNTPAQDVHWFLWRWIKHVRSVEAERSHMVKFKLGSMLHYLLAQFLLASSLRALRGRLWSACLPGQHFRVRQSVSLFFCLSVWAINGTFVLQDFKQTLNMSPEAIMEKFSISSDWVMLKKMSKLWENPGRRVMMLLQAAYRPTVFWIRSEFDVCTLASSRFLWVCHRWWTHEDVCVRLQQAAFMRTCEIRSRRDWKSMKTCYNERNERLSLLQTLVAETWSHVLLKHIR